MGVGTRTNEYEQVSDKPSEGNFREQFLSIVIPLLIILKKKLHPIIVKNLTRKNFKLSIG